MHWLSEKPSIQRIGEHRPSRSSSRLPLTREGLQELRFVQLLPVEPTRVPWIDEHCVREDKRRCPLRSYRKNVLQRQVSMDHARPRLASDASEREGRLILLDIPLVSNWIGSRRSRKRVNPLAGSVQSETRERGSRFVLRWLDVVVGARIRSNLRLRFYVLRSERRDQHGVKSESVRFDDSSSVQDNAPPCLDRSSRRIGRERCGEDVHS